MDADVKLSVSDSIQAVYNQKNQTVEILIGFKQMDDSATIGPDGIQQRTGVNRISR